MGFLLRHINSIITVLALCSLALAQTPTGAISGVVEDESGAVIPAANVSISNVDTGISRTIVTDPAGWYAVPGLIPGHYELRVQAAGFQTAVRRGIQLTVGKEIGVNVTQPLTTFFRA